jgi:acetyltransferase-like isoleucine patch superfamily enzyme
MKTLLEKVIRFRNPHFKFDEAVSSYLLFFFFIKQIGNLLRGSRLILLGKNPKMAMLGSGVRFFNLPKITFGKFMKLGKGVQISALGKTGVIIGNNVGIGDYSRVIVSTSLNQIGEYIKIGNNVGMGEYCYLGGAGGLEIGDDCIIGQYFSCHPENHIYSDVNELIRNQGVERKGIKIGNNCWIGSKVSILDGVEIGEGCVIAAGAVVSKSFPAYSVIGGVPAKLIKSRVDA